MQPRELRKTSRLLLLLPFLLCGQEKETPPDPESTPPDGQGVATLYPDATLSQKRPRYAENIRWNLDNVILGSLSHQVRSQIGGVQIEFPLHKARREPFAYYSYPAQRRIVMSVNSIKFFDDLSVAYIWLAENRYATTTIIDYAAVLKYCAPVFRQSGSPLPWDALGIPSSALTPLGGIVDENSQKVLKSGIIFVLAHEVGHVYYDHLTGIDAEMAADSFAVEVFRNIHVVPMGILLFFQLNTYMGPNRADFATATDWREYLNSRDHPLDSDRVTRLARELRRNPHQFIGPGDAVTVATIRELSDDIAELAGLLGDTDLQVWTRSRARSIPPAELRPRRPADVWVPTAGMPADCSMNH